MRKKIFYQQLLDKKRKNENSVYMKQAYKYLLIINFFILSLKLSGCHFVKTNEEIKPFTFVHISDSHIGASNSELHLKQVISDARSIYPEVDFIINSGDITDWGTEEEWRIYDEIISSTAIPVFNAMGNHDSRWSDNGTNYFTKLYGDTYYSFDHKGYHFIILNSSVLQEQYGHFSKSMLDWLKKDLENSEENQPIILALHHPLFLEKKFVSNQHELIKILEPFNVILILTGHGHGTRNWRVNGIDFLMTDGTMDRDFSYLIIQLDKQNVRVLKKEMIGLNEKIVLIKNLENISDSKTELNIEPADTLEFTNFKFEISDSIEGELFYKIDEMPEVPVDSLSNANKIIRLFPDSIADGNHTLYLIHKNDYDGIKETYINYTRFEKGLSVEKIIQTSGSFLSPLLLKNQFLYAGNDAGEFFVLDVVQDKILWKYKFDKPVVAKAALWNKTVFISCLDGILYAFDRWSGEELWNFETEKAIYATPLVQDDRVFFGSGDGNMYCINAEDGSLNWKFDTQRLIKNKAAYKDGKLIFGGWDNYLHCVDADKGNEIWRVQISKNRYFAAATSNPAISDSVVVIASHDHTVHAYNLYTGENKWTKNNMENAKPGYSSPLILDEKIYFGSLDGYIFSLNIQEGDLNYISKLNKFNDPVFDSSPVVYGEHILVGSIGGYVYCINLYSGLITNRIEVSDDYIFSTAAANMYGFFVASMDGGIYRVYLNN